jgi:membrane protein required for colicin V production
LHGINLVDILIWGILLFFMIKGFLRGFVREVCFLLGLLFGVWAAFRYYPSLVTAMRPYLQLPHHIASVISFILILLTLGLLFFLLGYLLTLLLEKYKLAGSLNRTGGIVFGFLQGAFLLCMILYFLTAGSQPNWLKLPLEKSKSAPTFILCGRELAAGWDGETGGRARLIRNR